MRTRTAVSILLGSLAVGCLMGTQPAAWAQSAPHWTVGDTWQVGVWQGQAYLRRGSGAAASQGAYNPRGRMITVSFQVSGVQTIGDQECYEVQVTFPREETGFRRMYQVYYAKDTGKLLRVKDVSLTPAGATRDVTTDYASNTSGPTAVYDVASLVPLDWPGWTQENVDAPASGARRTSQSTTHEVAQLQDGTSQPVDVVTLTTLAGQKEIRVVQQWSKGAAWWNEAKKYDNGRLVAEAMLLEVNGKKVANAPAAADGTAGGSPTQ